MKRLILIFAFFCFGIFFIGCKKTGCSDCTNQKHEFCLMLEQAGCNGALIQTNIDYLVQSCGQDKASEYISSATDSCTRGILVCPDGCE